MFVDIDNFKWKYEYLRNIYNNNTGYYHNLFIYGSNKNQSLHFILEFIKSIYCLHKDNSKNNDDIDIFKPCNKCSACNSIDNFNNINVKIIMPLVNENSELNREINELFCNYVKENIIIDEYSWNNKLKSTNKLVINKNSILKLQDFMLLQPLTNKPKICIIWLPELLNNSSANSMLKILEEPTKNTFFIFISNNDKKVLETIKSRTIKIFFEDKSIDTNVDDNNKIKYMELFIEFLRLCYVNNYEKNIEFIDKISKNNAKNEFTNIICNGLLIFRNIIYLNNNIETDVVLDENINKTIDKIKNILNFTSIKYTIEELEKSLILIQNNINVKVMTFNLINSVNKIIKKN